MATKKLYSSAEQVWQEARATNDREYYPKPAQASQAQNWDFEEEEETEREDPWADDP